MSKSAETSTMQTIIDNAAIGGQFMDIMQDYMARQDDDPNFDPRTALYDLYDDLVYIYEKAQQQ